ncbi:MAG TPA: DUF5305 family protein [Candidatus Saccharibacteria bacterium]|nr:DUF5305 family protein [Candidatus Saccharibacteria bacterium]
MRSQSSQEGIVYTVDQSFTPTVIYHDTSLFEESRGTQTAYVRELTKDISAVMSMRFRAKSATNLQYHYAITARVIASYALKGNATSDDAKPAVVWERLYQIDRADGMVNGDVVSLLKRVNIPYAEYAAKVSELNSVLGLNLNAKVEIVATVTVTGNNLGQTFSKPQSMILTVPLSDPVFTVASDYKKHDNGQIDVGGSSVAETPLWWRQHRMLIVVALAVLAVVSAVLALWLSRREGYGIRNPYQRAVAKIYRYHDGVIIRTNRPIELREREIISVKTFDDLLNVSDELRSPVIANELSDTATQFVVLHETTVYVYLVGRLVAREESLPIPKKKTTKLKNK